MQDSVRPRAILGLSGVSAWTTGPILQGHCAMSCRVHGRPAGLVELLAFDLQQLLVQGPTAVLEPQNQDREPLLRNLDLQDWSREWSAGVTAGRSN